MDMETINESVGVEVSFGDDRVSPTRFVWRNRNYEVRRVTMQYERKDGGKRFLCFAVDTGGMTAELVMDTTDFKWRVGRVESI